MKIAMSPLGNPFNRIQMARFLSIVSELWTKYFIQGRQRCRCHFYQHLGLRLHGRRPLVPCNYKLKPLSIFDNWGHQLRAFKLMLLEAKEIKFSKSIFEDILYLLGLRDPFSLWTFYYISCSFILEELAVLLEFLALNWTNCYYKYRKLLG